MSIHIFSVPADKAPLSLLLEADPSEHNIKKYLSDSLCYVAEISGALAGVYVLKKSNQSTFELMNISVATTYQAKGIGTKMLLHAISTAKQLGANRLEVGTGTFGYQLTFYQKAGFRVHSVERDFFLKHYDVPVMESGIRHKDMLRLAMDL